MAQSPQLNDSQLNLLAKIAANTGETQPKHGDGQHNLLFKIAQNTYASAVNSASDVSSVAGKTGAVTLVPTDIVGLQSALDGKLGESDTSYVIAQAGDNLATKYGQAKVLTPNGNARSATNRASLIVFPGVYSLSAQLTIDTEFVDIVGLGAQFQSPAVIVTNNTLNVTANDVRVSGISVGAQQFKTGNNKPLQVFENCKGTGLFSFSGGAGGSGGTFVNCVAGEGGFSGGGFADGKYTNCISGPVSFGAGVEASGVFTNCIGDELSFGSDGGILTGKLFSCRLSFPGDSYQTPSGSGIIRFCLDGDNNIVNADAP